MIPGDCRKAASLLGDLEFTSLISSVFLRGDFEVSRRGLINFTVRYCICASKALLGIEFSCYSLVSASLSTRPLILFQQGTKMI